MKRATILTAIAILGLAAATVQTSSAQAPTGSLTNLISGSTNVLWDFSLIDPLQHIDWNIEQASHGGGSNEVEIIFDDPYTADAKGKLSGAGTTSVAIITQQDDTTNNMTYQTKGSVSGTKGVGHLTFSAKIAGQATLQQKLRNVSAAGTYTVMFNANSNTVTGRQSRHASASGLGSISDQKAISGTIPSSLGDGSWTLVLTFTPGSNTNKLSGDATVTLNTGLSYPYTFTGTFTPHTGQSKLNLKGHDAGLGSTVQVTLQGSDIIRIVGRVAGQTVNLKQ